MPTAFVTGGSGLVGAALVSLLVAEGWHVAALARSPEAAASVAAKGADPVRGDLASPGEWGGRVAAADAVIHCGLPRLRPPVRARQVRRAAQQAAVEAGGLAREAAGRPMALASSALEGPGGRPLALAAPARAAEAAAAGAALRVVRLPWVYGPGGLLGELPRALREGRFRIVGPGGNRWALVSATDAAAALRAALDAPPGVYLAAEPVRPTQEEVVHHLCRGHGARRPDHAPPAMAALLLGGPLAEAVAADLAMDGPAPPGWTPASAWERDLAGALSPPAPPVPGG